MQEKKINTSFKENNNLYEVSVEVMASNRYAAFPKALIHFNLICYDTSKKRNKFIRNLQKKEVEYKKIFHISSRDMNPLIISSTQSSLEETILQKVQEQGFTIHEVSIEMFITPLIEEIRDTYELNKKACVPV